jgi:hypothetical protein
MIAASQREAFHALINAGLTLRSFIASPLRS